MEWCNYTASTPSFEDAFVGYETTARVVDCYDGDTLKVVMSFRGVVNKFTCRMGGIDTYEMRGARKDDAMRARNRVLQLIGLCIDLESRMTKKQVAAMLHDQVVLVQIVCGPLDKYGRLLCTVVPMGETRGIAEILIAEKLAVEYLGGTKTLEN